MLTWIDFERAAPEIAQTGKALLFHPDRGEVAILATIDAGGGPSVAPICPIFADRGVYVLASRRTPKVGHLQVDGRYALHALVGADDLEFQMRGAVRPVTSASEHEAVLSAIPFPSYDANDPLFELLISHALAVTWPTPGTPRRMSWSAG